MAEYNVLAGDIAVLAQIRSDIKEHGEKKERLDKLSFDVAELKKNIVNSEKAIKDEKESTLKKSRDAVSEGFDKAIAIDNDKIKKIQNDRDKARSKGIKERIQAETVSIKEENDEYNAEIREAFKLEGVSRVCSRNLFLSFFLTKGLKDVAVFILSQLVIYMLIPVIVYFAVPQMPGWGYILFYFVIVTIEFSVYKLVYDKLISRHIDTIYSARDIKKKITKNKKKIKKIEKSIKKDTNEEMYGLEDFDVRINSIYDDINKIEGERDLALQDFENTARPDIEAEIDGRDRERINGMKSELEKKTIELSKVEDLVKEQRIYISSNYEAYLSKDFATVEKLDELYKIMSSGAANTIGQAVALYSEKK